MPRSSGTGGVVINKGAAGIHDRDSPTRDSLSRDPANRDLPKKRVTLFHGGTFSRGYWAPFVTYPVYGLAGSAITFGSYFPNPPPTIIIVQPPREEPEIFRIDPPPRGREAPKEAVAPPPKPIDPFEGAEKPLPGVPAGGFRPLGPKDRPQPLMPRAEEAPKPVDKPDAAAHRPLDAFHRGIPLPSLPESDPKEENRRLVKIGKQTFAEQQYGRAAERFRQAVAVLPTDAADQFLLAQAYFSLGKFREAVDAIETGVRLQPDWPDSDFRPRLLYGGNESDFTDLMQRLDEALVRLPDDPVLLFLRAYQLWFDGRRSDAVPLLRHAIAVGSDKTAVERFLQAQP
ncbi:MAG: tetratricopeptide repeat protein [Gemmataceae bacterium]